MKTKKTTQKRWPPGRALPKLATVAEEVTYAPKGGDTASK